MKNPFCEILLKLTLVNFLFGSAQFQVHGLEAKRSEVLTSDPRPPESPRIKTSGIVFDCVETDKSCQKDKQGFDAITALHRLLDDDQNGNVDQSESDEFLRDELQYTDNFERQKTFHGNDKLISVNDLWHAWQGSEVYNWTTDEVLEWLECSVELPQYIEVFQQNSVDGPALPRLAYINSNFFTQTLGIKNVVHKQKISVKAMDAVLFGAPKKAHSYIKDIVLVTLLITALGGCWFAYVHHHYSQGHVKKMMKDLESLQKAEEALQELQEKLTMAEEKQNTVSKEKQTLEAKYKDEIDAAKPGAFSWDDLKEAERLKEARQGNNLEESLRLAEEELAQVRAALRRSEKELELQEHWSVPSELQVWLQLTHELEQAHYLAKRSAAEKQLLVAKEYCDKLRKRNKAFLGSLRMAHGNSLDEIDQRIIVARTAFEEVKQDLQERLHRWHTIESLCGFPIMTNPGLPTLKQILQKDSGQPNRGVLGAIGVEEADEDLPPAYSVLHSTNGSGRPRAHSVQLDHIPYNSSQTSLKSNSMKPTLSRRFSEFSIKAYQPSSQSKPNLPRLHSAPCKGSTGSLSRVGMTNGSSRQSESPGPSDHGSITPVSFHLGDNSQHHLHQLQHASLNGSHLSTTPISESPTESVTDHLLLGSHEDQLYVPKIPLSKSYTMTPTPSEVDIKILSQSVSTSALKKMAVNGKNSSQNSSEDHVFENIMEDRKENKKKRSFFKMLKRASTKSKDS